MSGSQKRRPRVREFTTHFGETPRGGRLHAEFWGLWSPGTRFRVIKVSRGRFHLVRLTGPGHGRSDKGVYRISRRRLASGREKPVLWLVSREFQAAHRVQIRVFKNHIEVTELAETVERLPSGRFRVKETVVRSVLLGGFEEEAKAMALAERLRQILAASKRFTEVSLFAGIGGAQEAGRGMFKTLYALDKSETAAQVFRLNFPDVPYLVEDIRDFLRTVPAPVPDRPDGVIMTPPCVDFSRLRRAIKLREGAGIGLEGAESGLALEGLRVVGELKPRHFVFLENVPPVARDNGGEARDILKEALAELGYPYFYDAVMPALGYAPTLRYRWYAVALAVDAPFQVPPPSSKVPRLGDIMFPDEEVPESYNWSEGSVRRFRERPLLNAALGRNFKYLIADENSTHAATLTFNSYKSNENSQIYRRPDGTLRKFMEREIVRSMGFPDWFKLPDWVVRGGRRVPFSWTLTCQLFGNSVVPPVLRAWFRQIREALITHYSWVTVKREGRAAVQLALAL